MSIMQLTQTIHILPSGNGLQSNRALQPTLAWNRTAGAGSDAET